jgi:hypothetical protein
MEKAELPLLVTWLFYIRRKEKLIMKKVGLIMLSILLFFFVGASSAAEITRFAGEFIRRNGPPVAETVQQIPGIPGSGFLRVYNGASDDSIEKVSSSIIKINNIDLLTQEDFNQNVDYLETDILLKEQNTITVELKGKPGGKIWVEIIQDGILIPDTGQTTSYTDTFGEDSDYNINLPSYTKLDSNGNELDDSAPAWAMVRDNVTKLVWEVKNNKDGFQDYSDFHDGDNTYYWCDSNPETNGGNQGACTEGTDTEDFIAALNAQNFGGYTDWRLPTVLELSQLVHHGAVTPAINKTYFPNTMFWVYQTSTTCAQSPNSSWVVDFWGWSGGTYYSMPNSKSNSYYVRAVRGGKSSLRPSLVDNGDGTVTDIQTGLIWQQSEAGAIPWEEALTYCENLELAGYDDWRLPNCNELQTIVDYSEYDPAIDLVAFPNAFSNVYWTSTTMAASPGAGWTVTFLKGEVAGGANKLYGRYVRAVRGGQ